MSVMKEYSEIAAREYVTSRLDEAGLSCPADFVGRIIVLIWDAYDKLGLLEIDDDVLDGDVDDEIDSVCDYVVENLADPHDVNRDIVKLIIKAEEDYEMSLI